MQIDSCLIAASYQETVSCRYTAHWYAQWSPMAQNHGHSAWKRKEHWQYLKGKSCGKLYGPVKGNELWRIRRNDELEAIINPLNPELNPICYLLALLAHHFLHVSRIRVKSLTLR